MTPYERAMWTGLNRAMEEGGARIGDASLTISREGDDVVFSSYVVETERVPFWCDGKPVHRAARVRQAKRLDQVWRAYAQKVIRQLGEDIVELDRRIARNKRRRRLLRVLCGVSA